MSREERTDNAPSGEDEDSSSADETFHEQEARRQREGRRPLVHDQEPTGEQGISSDKAGHDFSDPERP